MRVSVVLSGSLDQREQDQPGKPAPNNTLEGDFAAYWGRRLVTYSQLMPWEELIGFFQHIEITEDAVIVTISWYHLRYPRRSPEAEFLIKNLPPEKIGRRVGILNAEKDIRIHWPDELPRSNEPSPFWKWYCETYGSQEGW